jgi:uncharacterized protein
MSTSETERIGDWMQTYTGYQFWPADPRAEEIHLADIAHSLANQCRFAGHCLKFYSVAQHSIIVSRIVPPEDAAWGLLHDATEAYLVDLPRPVKRYSKLGDEYRQLEGCLMTAICERFALPPEEPDSVKLSDDIVLMTEKRDLMPGLFKWREVATPLPEEITPMAPEEAEIAFLDRALEIGLKMGDMESRAHLLERGMQ